MCAAAGFQPEFERADLLPARLEFPDDAGRRRPADVYLPRWQLGTPAALDLAIVSPQRQGALDSGASRQAGAAAAAYEEDKVAYQNTGAQCHAQGLQFIPLVAESSGGWGKPGAKTLYQIAKAASTQDDRDVDDVLVQYDQRLSVVIRRAHGEAVLRRVRGAD